VCLLGDVGRTGQQGAYVDADQGGRENPHRRKHRKAPAHVGRDFHRGDALIARDAPQGADLRIGHQHEMLLCRLLADGLRQRFADDEVLRHGFHRPSRLGDHEHQRARQVETGERGTNGRRIHVIEHVEARMSVALLLRELVPPWRAQGRTERDGAEGRTADPEQQDIVELTLHRRRHGERLVEQRGVAGECEKAEIVRAGVHGSMSAGKGIRRRGELLRGDAGAVGQGSGHHVGEIERKRHGHCSVSSTTSPSCAGMMPGGNSAARSAWKFS